MPRPPAIGRRLAAARLGALLLLLAGLIPPARAADTPASLHGVVKDPSGSAVPGARVELTRPGAATLAAETGPHGAYRIDGIAAGSWSLLLTHGGFAPYAIGSLSFSAGRDLELDLRLELAPVQRAVTVADEQTTLVLEPTGNAGAIVLKGEDLETLPDDPDELAEALQALAGPAAGPNGGQMFIDGFSGGRMPPKNAIREIRLNSNPFSAEFDRLGFGRIEILTRPGADKLGAEAAYRFNDESLNSRNPFAEDKVDFQRRDLDASLTGPLRKERVSFFVDFDRRDTDDNAIINATILDPTLTPAEVHDTVVTPRHRTSVGPRLDLQLSPGNTLVARYTHTSNSDPLSGIGDYSLESRAYERASDEDSFDLTDTIVIGKSTNETRLRYTLSRSEQRAEDRDPALSVLDSFTGGGSQVGRSSQESRDWELSNVTAFSRGRHSFRAGLRLRTTTLDDISTQNYGGTITFSGALGPQLDGQDRPVLDPDGQPIQVPLTSLERYRRTIILQEQGRSSAEIRALGGGASQLRIAGGDPRASVSQWDIGPFLQDDWKASDSLLVSLGLRYERQNHISSPWNLAPRAGFAWSPGKPAEAGQSPLTVVRGGFGVFYDRVGADLSLNAEREDGEHQQNYQVTDPAILDQMTFTIDSITGVPTVGDLEQFAVPQAIRQLDPEMEAPYTLQSSLSLERQLPGGFTLSGTWINARGRRQLRSRNINAPLADGSYPLGADAGPVYQYESTGELNQQQLIFGANNRYGRRFTAFARYFLNWARSDTDGAGTFPASSWDLDGEYAPSLNDVRHRFVLGGNVTARWGIRLSPFVIASSGRPFNITTGGDNNGDTLFTDRPSYASDPSRPGVVQTPYGALDPNPLPGDEIIPRNLGRGPAFFTVNLRLSKTIPLTRQAEAEPGDRPRGMSGPGPWGGGPGGGHGPGGGGRFGGGGPGLTLSLSAQNLLNNVNLAPPVGNLTSPLFGESTSITGGFGMGGRGGGSASGGNRRIEMQARVQF